MERKLATIRKIKELNPIPGADRIEVATVDGWKVVTQKGIHKVGDLVVYCEIDSFLPVREEFEFLRKSGFRKMADGSEGFRLRTVKLRGQISQGLILPLEVVNANSNITIETFFEGLEVTDMLGVKKFEMPIPADLDGEVVGGFPSFIPKTDEERIQNMADIYDDLRGKFFYETEKLDGSSTTYFYNDGVFGVCGRNWEYIEAPKNTQWRIARELDIEEKLKSLGKNVAIQGECIGEGIQGNPYKLIGQTVKFFTAFDIDKYKRFQFYDFKNLINNLGLDTVPIVSERFVLPSTMDELLKIADDVSLLNPKAKREGIVFRALDEHISFKVISDEFLVEND